MSDEYNYGPLEHELAGGFDGTMERVSCQHCKTVRTLWNEELEFKPAWKNGRILCTPCLKKYEEYRDKRRAEEALRRHQSGTHSHGFCPYCPPNIFHD